ncbi:MAG: gamma-glutamyl-gamma-aminobutyrate hydrolase family protein [Gemmatimonadaceae bacterium]
MSITLTQDIPRSRSPGSKGIAPVVAVSATSDTRLGGAHRVRLNSTYLIALESAGLVPIIIPPLASPDQARSILERVDGVLLTGGEDVDPALYGQDQSKKCGAPNRARDETEIALALGARDLNKPLLAICRGPQLLNVAFGGTLIQDIPSEIPGALNHNADDDRGGRVHHVSIQPGSLTARSIGATDVSVNSLHHQSVKDVAPGFRVTATSPDGIVEAIEWDGADWWALAVQWHPEEMNDSPEPWDRGLFRAFADKLTGE